MTVKHLSITAIALFLFWLLINYVWVAFAPVTSHGGFFFLTNLMFFILILFTFAIAHFSLKTKNPALFLYAFTGSIFLKFMVGLTIIIIYHFASKPEDLWYLAPFFMLFVTYKGLELFGMMMLNKQSAIEKTALKK